MQRLRRELEATRAELSNARVARDKAVAECAELRAQLDADEAQVREELARLKFDTRWEYKTPDDPWTVISDIDSFLRENGALCEASNILEMGIDREYVHPEGRWRIRRVRRRQITPE